LLTAALGFTDEHRPSYSNKELCDFIPHQPSGSTTFNLLCLPLQHHHHHLLSLCRPAKKKTHRKKHSQDITNVHGSLMVSMTVPVRPPNGTYTHFVVEISRLVGGFIYLFQPPKLDDDPL
jgi:hypothetical protein